MVLCLCNNITESDWAEALHRHGYDVAAAQQACGAGECCGACLDSLHERVPVPVGLALAIG